MNERRRAGAVMFAAMALAFATTPPALAQEATCKRRSNNPSLKRPDNLVAPE